MPPLLKQKDIRYAVLFKFHASCLTHLRRRGEGDIDFAEKLVALHGRLPGSPVHAHAHVQV